MVVKKRAILSQEIKKGIPDKQKYKWIGEGDYHPNITPGNIIMTVEE